MRPLIVLIALALAACAPPKVPRPLASPLTAALTASPTGTSYVAAFSPGESLYQAASRKVNHATGMTEQTPWVLCGTGNVPVHSCTNFERWQRETFRIGVAIPQALDAAVKSKSCAGLAKQLAAGTYGKIIVKFLSNYYGRAIQGGNLDIKKTGNVYLFDADVLDKLAGCLVRTNSCASMSTDLLDVLDLKRTERGCVEGADFAVPQLTPATYDTSHEHDGVQHTASTPRALTTKQLALVDATDQAHFARMQWLCSGGPVPDPKAVQTTHAALEATAVDLDQRAFLTFVPFWGDYSADWTPGERCTIDHLRHQCHSEWATAVKARDWKAAETATMCHTQAHVLGNLGKLPATYRFPVAGQGPNAWPIERWDDVLGR